MTLSDTDENGQKIVI